MRCAIGLYLPVTQQPEWVLQPAFRAPQTASQSNDIDIKLGVAGSYDISVAKRLISC
jgi:hypothetical protein